MMTNSEILEKQEINNKVIKMNDKINKITSKIPTEKLKILLKETKRDISASLKVK